MIVTCEIVTVLQCTKYNITEIIFLQEMNESSIFRCFFYKEFLLILCL